MTTTTPARWAETERLFDAAAALPEAEQGAFLERACADAALRGEVARLLASARASGAFLEPAAPPLADTHAPSLPPGTELGPWRIDGPLGRGGMSEVYRAHRADGQYEQRAAVKLLSRELAQKADDFYHERQLLAQLEHPLIARLLDGGLAADGRPYMVMEYVEGANLVQHCQATSAGLHERLRLFIQACEAVAYAHRNLIVHRDLKPSNILVTPAGQVKLLDFGIARLVDAGLPAGELSRTLHLTPGYAAPEQLTGRAVTTATDCYALGVLLHELLTGVPPFRLGSLPLALAVQRVLHDTPPPLSAAARDAGAPLPPRLLRGDLEAIVAKALRKEPEARYASAAELKADLERYLRHEPVAARGYALGYVTRRFVRRHRVLAAAAAAVLLTLGLATARVALEAGHARRERDSAQAVTEFLTQDLLGSANAWERQGKDFTVKAALDLAAQRVGERFAGKPALAARVHATLGDAYFSLGESAAAFTHLTRANELYRDAGDPDPAARAKVLDVLASQHLARGDNARGCALYAELRALRERAFPPQHLEVLRARSRGAMCLVYGGKPAAAAAEYRAVLDAATRSGAPEDFIVSELSVQLAYVLNDLARWDEAEPLFRKIREHRIRAKGADHISVGVMALVLAPALYNRGQFDEAERELRAGLALVRRHVGDDQIYVPWFTLELGQVALQRGESAVAERHLREALRRYQAIADASGEDDAALSNVAYDLARAEREQGRFAEAAARIRAALPRTERLAGAAHPSAIGARTLLAECLLAAGRAAEARAALAEIPAEGLRELPERHPLYAQNRRVEGLLAQAEGRHDDARAALAEALAIHEQRHGGAHPRTRQLRAELAALRPG